MDGNLIFLDFDGGSGGDIGHCSHGVLDVPGGGMPGLPGLPPTVYLVRVNIFTAVFIVYV